MQHAASPRASSSGPPSPQASTVPSLPHPVFRQSGVPGQLRSRLESHGRPRVLQWLQAAPEWRHCTALPGERRLARPAKPVQRCSRIVAETVPGCSRIAMEAALLLSAWMQASGLLLMVREGLVKIARSCGWPCGHGEMKAYMTSSRRRHRLEGETAGTLRATDPPPGSAFVNMSRRASATKRCRRASLRSTAERSVWKSMSIRECLKHGSTAFWRSAMSCAFRIPVSAVGRKDHSAWTDTVHTRSSPSLTRSTPKDACTLGRWTGKVEGIAAPRTSGRRKKVRSSVESPAAAICKSDRISSSISASLRAEDRTARPP